jgi:PBSX family phage terminase large subunit
MDPNGPEFIAYYGGYGSGKSLVLCVINIMWGVLFGGEYIISRQFMPELRRTTMKLFKELLPKELLIEERIADAQFRIRSAKGEALFHFVGLDEPGKLDSLTLDGVSIDEASQTSEEALLKLQGRIRGKKGLRKILLVGNPKGHDFVYKYFIKQDCFTEFKDPISKKMVTVEQQRRKYRMIVAPSTENVHLPPNYVAQMLQSYSPERIQRDIMGSFDAFQGQVYTEFRRDVHVIKGFRIPDDWTKFIGLDHGYVNPCAIVWVAVDYDGNLYAYREMYKREWKIDEIVNGNKDTGEHGIVGLSKGEKIEGIWIDPSTKADRGKESDYTTYLENLPKNISLLPANNSVSTGIDRVKQYMRVNERTGRPRLYIFDSCSNLIDELIKYRWEELAPGSENKKNNKEAPVKKDDHACFMGGVTSVTTAKGQVDISELRAGDLVLTSLGYRKVLSQGITGYKPVYKYTFTNNTFLFATEDHPVLLANGKTRPINTLTPSDIIATLDTCRLNSTVSFLEKLATTIVQTVRTANAVLKLCIEKFGNFIRDLSNPATISTTSTVIPTITTSLISNVCLEPNTLNSTLDRKSLPSKTGSIWNVSDLWQQHGTKAAKVDNGIGNTVSKWQRKFSPRRLLRIVQSALRNILSLKPSLTDVSSVTRTAKPPLFVSVEPVYNISVEGVSEFYANGVLVSNCDALRYAVMSRPEAPLLDEFKSKQRQQSTLSGSVQRELHDLKKGSKGTKDLWGDEMGRDPGMNNDF